MKKDYELFMQIPEPPRELDFVDEDIRAMFENKGGYPIGMPTQVQIVKELQALRRSIDDLAYDLREALSEMKRDA